MKIIYTNNSVAEYSEIDVSNSQNFFRKIVSLDEIVFDNNMVYVQSKPVFNKGEETVFRFLETSRGDFFSFIFLIMQRPNKFLTEEGKKLCIIRSYLQNNKTID